MTEKIIVMGGSFNPPTLAHLRLMQSAIEQVGADKGVFAPSNHEYVRRKMKRSGTPSEVLPEELRLEMLLKMCETDKRLSVDTCEYTREIKGYTYETMLSIQENNPESEIYFLAGGDKVNIISRWHRIDEFLRDFKIIVTRRDGSDPAADIEENPYLRLHKDRFTVINSPDGIEGISSSAVRERLHQGDFNLDDFLHPAVAELLIKNGGMVMEINRFSDEYRFLSNFYPVPVTYGGLTYKNNEAAFQAQKCLDDEVKKQFTEYDAGKAKGVGRHVDLRPDWEEVKVGIMEEIVRAKFTQNEAMKQKLIATAGARLVEGNNWHDVFWGVDLKTGEGENHLGEILMKVRAELLNGNE